MRNDITYKFANFILKKIKRKPFLLDSEIPFTYLFNLLIHRMFMLARGYLTFCKHGSYFFRDKNTLIKAKNKIKIGRGVTIGRNCYIDAISKSGIILGDHVSIGKNTTIECSGTLQNLGVGLIVGNFVGMGTHGFFGCAGGVEIGADTIFGNFVSLHSENHNFSNIDVPIRLQGINRMGIKIGNNCWIGAKVTILDGAIIENGCIIAAGALITKGIYKANSIYAGVPAKLLRKRINEK